MIRPVLARALSGTLALAAVTIACSGSEESASPPASGGTGALGTGGLGVSGTLGGGGLGLAGAPVFDGGLAGFGGAGGAADSGAAGSGGLPTGGAAGAGGSGGVVVTCPAPTANCDANEDCETDLSKSPNSCQSATVIDGPSDLGVFCGDAVCNTYPVCGVPVSWKAAKGVKSRGSRWFWATAGECSLCSADINALALLRSPPGTNYDLFMYEACGTLVGSSTKPAGQDDQLALVQKETSGPQGFNYWVEVRWESGNTCEDWQLQIYKSGCPF